MFSQFFQHIEKNLLRPWVLSRIEKERLEEERIYNELKREMEEKKKMEEEKKKLEEERECSCCFDDEFNTLKCPHPNCSYLMCEKCWLQYKEHTCPNCRQHRFDETCWKKKCVDRVITINKNTLEIVDSKTGVFLYKCSPALMQQILKNKKN